MDTQSRNYSVGRSWLKPLEMMTTAITMITAATTVIDVMQGSIKYKHFTTHHPKQLSLINLILISLTLVQTSFTSVKLFSNGSNINMTLICRSCATKEIGVCRVLLPGCDLFLDKKMMWVTSWKLHFECWNTKVQISKHNYWFSESLSLKGLNLGVFMNLISECWVPPFWNPGSDKKS